MAEPDEGVSTMFPEPAFIAALKFKTMLAALLTWVAPLRGLYVPTADEMVNRVTLPFPDGFL